MNVDKFGHHVHKRLRRSEPYFDPEQVLVRSENGEFDLHSARLRGLKNPSTADDAANKQYVDNLLNDYYTKLDIIAELHKVKTDIINLIRIKFYMKEEVDKAIAESKSKVIENE